MSNGNSSQGTVEDYYNKIPPEHKIKHKELKTVAECQAEYQKLCQIAGDKQYRAFILSGEVEQINLQLIRLNKEYDDAEALLKSKQKAEASLEKS